MTDTFDPDVDTAVYEEEVRELLDQLLLESRTHVHSLSIPYLVKEAFDALNRAGKLVDLEYMSNRDLLNVLRIDQARQMSLDAHDALGIAPGVFHSPTDQTPLEDLYE